MNKKVIIGIGIGLVLVLVFFMVGGSGNAESSGIVISAEKGLFEVRINTTGELEAKNSVKILGPTGLRNFRIFQVNIQSIAEEGKQVNKGDWIASLDPSELTNKLGDAQTELDQKQSQYTQTRLDTTLQMRQARDELINLKYGVEEKQIVLDQSQFEPPAMIKQAEINLDKARRAYEQAKENYKIKLEQNQAKMMEVSASLGKARREFDALLELRESFTIKAPEAGMLIYRKGWDGRPIKEGSQISAWDPVVATLPDLSVMISKTYVNEVDVRKIEVGQMVDIGLDAFPDKKLKGQVINVANVGEQRPNSDAKVFQVDVQIEGFDPLLKPSMTTSNSVIAFVEQDVIHIPLECLRSRFDSITYVVKKDGLNSQLQEVILGPSNSEEAVVLAGVNEGDRLYLSSLSDAEEDEINLLPELNGKRNSEEVETDLTKGNESQSKNEIGKRGGKRKN